MESNMVIGRSMYMINAGRHLIFSICKLDKKSNRLRKLWLTSHMKRTSTIFRIQLGRPERLRLKHDTRLNVQSVCPLTKNGLLNVSVLMINTIGILRLNSIFNLWSKIPTLFHKSNSNLQILCSAQCLDNHGLVFLHYKPPQRVNQKIGQ